MTSLVNSGSARARAGVSAAGRFIGPRYWLSWIFIGWIGALAALPFRIAYGCQRRIGRLAYALVGRRGTRIEACIANVFPSLGRDARRALVCAWFENVSASIAELALAWFGGGRSSDVNFDVMDASTFRPRRSGRRVVRE